MHLLKTFTPRKSHDTGFTLVEILVVLGIFVFIAVLGLFLSTTTLRNSSFGSDINIVASVLQRARSRATANINESSHGVRLDGSGYTIFQGPPPLTFASRVTSLDESIQAGAAFSFLPIATIDIIFTQLSGESSFSGPIVITNGFNTATISLNYEGQISW